MVVKLFLLSEGSSLIFAEGTLAFRNTQHCSSVKLFHLKIMSSQEFEKLNLLRIFMRGNYHETPPFTHVMRLASR